MQMGTEIFHHLKKVLHDRGLSTWIKAEKLDIEPTMEGICSSQHVADAIQKDIVEYNPTFGKWEQEELDSPGSL